MHRLYENEDITIFWDSDRCRHARECIGSMPEVFEFARKPWIDLSRGENKDIWSTVKRCPSGALDICYNHGIKIEFKEELNCSIAYDKGNKVGESDYEVREDGFLIYHTEVLPEYGGRGIAKRLVYKIVEEAERRGASILPVCSYAAGVLSK